MKKYIYYIIFSLVLFILSFGFATRTNALTGYTRLFDGGVVLSVITTCTCSGGMLIEFQSFVDNSSHQYIYQYGLTQLYSYYNIFSGGNYFLSTHFPSGVCLVYSGNSCTSYGSPEGTLTQIGSSI
jgi:hypothetical protein